MKDYRKLISKHRNAIMGLMAIIIIIYHAKWSTNNWLFENTINKYGSIGVDVFVFVSGFGLAYALTKYDSFEKYIIKRFRRILPAYYMFEILNLLVALVLLIFGIKNNLMQPIESILPVGVWVNFDSNRNLAYKWYISAILGFYLISALIYPAMRRSKYLYLTTFLMLLITVGFIPYISDMSNMPFAVQRIPALVTGLAVGVASLRKEKKYQKSSIGLICLVVLCAIGVTMIAFEGKMPGEYLTKMTSAQTLSLKQSLIAPLFTVLLACIFELLNYIHLNKVVKYFVWLGKLSLELYLIHSILYGLLELTSLSKSTQILMTVLLSIPAAVLLKWLSEKLLVLWEKISIHFFTKDNNTMNIAQIEQ